MSLVIPTECLVQRHSTDSKLSRPSDLAEVLPKPARLSAMVTPQLRSASIFACAVLLAPPITAPA
ncbi:MAG: hypothetical protein FJ167_05745 [Gammaproteobacteria bacterium]|nr:hypothetical protein [Gammaproteobacteria bacterium]